ncbi:hypothetical protein K0I73_01945 [Shewanella mesophila]|uniref:hypothetical protein n=1 Tax=Shewanella mesophila TaxID=2864208 RepID=UPI001C657F3D|nr:hypothetical protein [Shewanella mesophila]QYJ86541.1 hypothetical protein K0I73_01945 [Shewanella mesophila]
MKNYQPILFVIVLLLIVSAAIVSINQDQKTQEPETWSAFVYAHGYNSGRYKKTDDFDDYPSCKLFAEQQASELGNVVWECGLRCRFDSSRQGYQCETMQNN